LYFQTGKVKYTYKYYPVVDLAAQRGVNESHWAAYAAECANRQGKFWQMYDKLFSEWRGEFAGTYTKANLKKFGADIGLDTATFNKCVDNDETKPVIDADMAEVNRLGISGTPTFMINGRMLNVRTLDVSEFARTFDSLLK
jgi:protein-disulfide isomerase